MTCQWISFTRCKLTHSLFCSWAPCFGALVVFGEIGVSHTRGKTPWDSACVSALLFDPGLPTLKLCPPNIKGFALPTLKALPLHALTYPYRLVCAWMTLSLGLVTYCALLTCCILLALLFTYRSLIACIPVLLRSLILPMCICSSFILISLLLFSLFLFLLSILLLFCSCARASLLCRFS